MKDYASMSDFEINSAVHNALLSEPYYMLFMGNDRIEWTSKDGRKIVTDRVPYTKNGVHDYCNNPADAWPIIHQHGISIAFDKNEDEWLAWGDFAFDQVDWGMKREPEVACAHASPLRAAMIVFLMMKEGE